MGKQLFNRIARAWTPLKPLTGKRAYEVLLRIARNWRPLRGITLFSFRSCIIATVPMLLRDCFERVQNTMYKKSAGYQLNVTSFDSVGGAKVKYAQPLRGERFEYCRTHHRRCPCGPRAEWLEKALQFQHSFFSTAFLAADKVRGMKDLILEQFYS